MSSGNLPTFDLIDLYDKNVWHWPSLSVLMNINTIIENPSKLWDWTLVSNRSDVTMDIVRSNSQIPWNWSVLSTNQSISIADIMETPWNPWNLEFVACRPDITPELIEQYPRLAHFV